jgi:hypothetical protein
VPPKFLLTAGKGILFLDELTSAPQMTQANCYQLLLDRKLGEYVLPDSSVVIAAGNPASERGVHFSMPCPLRNRFVHLELEADLNDWCKWAVGVRSEINAFLRFKPDLLHTADAISDANAWPTPRFCESDIAMVKRGAVPGKRPKLKNSHYGVLSVAAPVVVEFVLLPLVVEVPLVLVVDWLPSPLLPAPIIICCSAIGS